MWCNVMWYIHTYNTIQYNTLHTYIHYIHTYIHPFMHTYIHTSSYIHRGYHTPPIPWGGVGIRGTGPYIYIYIYPTETLDRYPLLSPIMNIQMPRSSLHRSLRVPDSRQPLNREAVGRDVTHPHLCHMALSENLGGKNNQICCVKTS